jgi:hypothetical protein
MLEEAVLAYREGLKETIRERAPLQWAMTQMSLALVRRALFNKTHSRVISTMRSKLPIGRWRNFARRMRHFTSRKPNASVEKSSHYRNGRTHQKTATGLSPCLITGMAESGGKIAAQAIPHVKKETLCGIVLENIDKGSIVSTNELYSYNLLGLRPGFYSRG